MEPATRKLVDEAVLHLEHAVRMHPAHPRYNALLGEAYLLRGDVDEALAPLQNSFMIEPFPRTAWLLAATLLHLERPVEAERLATAAIDEAPGFHRAFVTRADARELSGNLEGAILDMRDAMDLAPDEESYRTRLADLVERKAGVASIPRTQQLTATWFHVATTRRSAIPEANA